MKKSDISNNIGAKEHIRNGLLGSLFAAACGHPLFAIGSIVAGLLGANSDIKKANQIYDQHAHFFENCELHWKLYDEAQEIRDEYSALSRRGLSFSAREELERVCDEELEKEKEEIHYHGETRVQNLASQLGHGFTMWTPSGKIVHPIMMLDVTLLREIKKARKEGKKVTWIKINAYAYQRKYNPCREFIICIGGIDGDCYYPMYCHKAQEIYTKLSNEAYALGYRKEY